MDISSIDKTEIMKFKYLAKEWWKLDEVGRANNGGGVARLGMHQHGVGRDDL